MSRIVILSLIVALATPTVALADPWADTVVSYNAGDATDFTNSAAALGEPSRTTAAWPSGTESVRMTVAPWQDSEVLKIGNGGHLVVAFNEAVQNDPLNPFGVDLLVFTNLALASSDWPANQTIGSPLFSFGGQIGQVYVSQDNATWYEVTDPGTMFPTQGYLSPEADAWATGAAPTSYTLPVDPSLPLDIFAGLTLTQAQAIYGGSGGGMGVDLSNLEGGTVNLDWISYVKIEGPTNAVDGFADVAVPEPATMTMLGAGLAALVLRRRRRDGR
ncbi:MAG: PEP-CTERM sorting domain-containing protein [Anaerolineaceae bacterium]|nr:PEP-CTERM sorting domain-containing protein [Anaerolineaceae bacterium]